MNLPSANVFLTLLTTGLWLAIGGNLPAAEPIQLLKLNADGTDPKAIDYEKLPKLTGTLSVIRQATLLPDKEVHYENVKFQLHNYLIFHEGKFWCIWSEGPPVEDEPTQEVRYATSPDGQTWSESQTVTGVPAAPYAYIARGFWLREGKLLALAAHFKGKGAFGADKELALQAFEWDQAAGKWKFMQKLYDNAINNFSPQRLPSGDWILTRRDARFNVSMLIGGRKAVDDWQVFPVINRLDVPGFIPDEPVFWPLADGSLFALYRDNSGTQRLFQSTSADEGRTWTKPALTNYPNATSKLFSLATSHGYRVMVSNANPTLGRRQLHLSLSPDGRTFTRLAELDVPSSPPSPVTAPFAKRFTAGISSLQYPHVIEHDDHLLIAFSRNKKQTDVLRVALKSVDALLKN